MKPRPTRPRLSIRLEACKNCRSSGTLRALSGGHWQIVCEGEKCVRATRLHGSPNSAAQEWNRPDEPPAETIADELLRCVGILLSLAAAVWGVA